MRPHSAHTAPCGPRRIPPLPGGVVQHREGIQRCALCGGEVLEVHGVAQLVSQHVRRDGARVEGDPPGGVVVAPVRARGTRTEGEQDGERCEHQK